MTHTIPHELTQVYISSCSSSLDLFWPQLFYNTTMSLETLLFGLYFHAPRLLSFE